jgi:hypothetical protein
LKKKNQKTFIRLAATEWLKGRTLHWMESFFASFCSQKEDLPFLHAISARQAWQCA